MISASLTPDLEEFVRTELARGRYNSADDLVREAIALLRDQERRADELRKELDAGLRDIEQGNVIRLEDEKAQDEFFRGIQTRGMERLNAKRSTPGE